MVSSIVIFKKEGKDFVLNITHEHLFKRFIKNKIIECFKIENYPDDSTSFKISEVYLISGKTVFRLDDVIISKTFSEITFKKSTIIYSPF
jgi:hypothetical protein